MDKHQTIDKERTEGKEYFQVKLPLVNSSKWDIKKKKTTLAKHFQQPTRYTDSILC